MEKHSSPLESLVREELGVMSFNSPLRTDAINRVSAYSQFYRFTVI